MRAGPLGVGRVVLVPHGGGLTDVRHVSAALPDRLLDVIGVRLSTGRLGSRRVLVAVSPVTDSMPVSVLTLDRALDRIGRPTPVLCGGSRFRLRVLAALMSVPCGEVITYGRLAERAGSPGGARAVGRVMATNPTPLIVPCHRVVAADGGPGGFLWGEDVKRALLAAEGADVQRTRPGP